MTETIVLEEPRVVPVQTKLFYDFEELVDLQGVETIYDILNQDVTVLMDLKDTGYEPEYVLDLIRANIEFVEFRVNIYGMYPDGSLGKYPYDYKEFYIKSEDFKIVSDRLSFVLYHKTLHRIVSDKSARLSVHLVKYYG